MKAKTFWFITGSLWGLTIILTVYTVVVAVQNLFLNLLIKGIQ